MNILTTYCRRIFFRKIKPIRNLISYKMSTVNYEQFDNLRKQFSVRKDMAIFNDIIIQSNNVVDNIIYFKIFKLLEDNQSPIAHYNDLFLQIYQVVSKKSDNVRMLLAKIKVRVAKKHQMSNQLKDALASLEQAMEVLQQNLVPPLLLYYQIYRFYGHIQEKIGNKKEALQALKQSVEMIEAYIGHSDDTVSTNQNTKSQAKACTSLVLLEPADSQKWLKKAYQYWQIYQGNRYQLQQYLQTIIINATLLLEKDRQKGLQFIIANKFQFKKQQFKKRLQDLKAK